MKQIDPDSFGEWLAHPITEILMAVLRSQEAHLKEEWCALSLEGGACDPITLAKFRERRSAYRDIREMTSEKLEDLWNEQ